MWLRRVQPEASGRVQSRERESRRPDLGSRLNWAMRGGVGRVREEEKREGKQTKRGAEEQEKKQESTRPK